MRAPRLARFVRAVDVLPVLVFVSMFAWSFVYVTLPFYAQTLSPGDETAVLQWTGWILGITALLAVMVTPLWVMAAARRPPGGLLVTAFLFSAGTFLLMAVARTLPELFTARLLLGLVGSPATIIIMVAGRGLAEDVTRRIAWIQTSMSLGLLFGPFAGAFVAARLGFLASFLTGAVLFAGCAVTARRKVVGPPVAPRPTDASAAGVGFAVAVATLAVLVSNTHVVFLGALLPSVLRDDLSVDGPRALDAAGGLTFVGGLALAAGSLAAPRLAARLGRTYTMSILMLASSVCLGLLPAMRDLTSFAVMRTLQLLLVAPVMTLAVVDVARIQFAQGLALVNAARNIASFIAPVVATAIAFALGTAAVDWVLSAAGILTAGLLAGLGLRARQEKKNVQRTGRGTEPEHTRPP